MRILSILLCVFLVYCKPKTESVSDKNSESIDSFSIGQSLFIIEKQGLNLRSGPGTSFDKIGFIPFGTSVNVLNKSDTKETLYKISSYWYEIKPNDSVNGWVFGGFLDSNFNSLLSTHLPKIQENCSSLEAYADNNFIQESRVTDLVYSGYGDENEEGNFIENYTTYFKNGASFEYRYQAKENNYYELTIKNANVLDAFILLKSCQSKYGNSFDKVEWKSEYLTNKKIYYKNIDGIIWEYTIEEIDRDLKIIVHSQL
jgi:uncharacterized protein YgiM (DUF1202 family)